VNVYPVEFHAVELNKGAVQPKSRGVTLDQFDFVTFRGINEGKNA
jgi:hypothetical protein